MKRKLMFATLLIFVLITLSCVSAADEIQTDDFVAIDDVQSEDISISDDLASEEILTDGESGTGSLSDLKSDIETSGTTEYNLTKNYTYNDESDGNYISNYLVDNFVLDGKGYTINGGSEKNIFNITANNVIIKNINFVNGHPAIFVGEGCTVNIIGCNFTRCSADNYGGAIYSSGNLSVDSCQFEYNTAQRGGAIYSTGNMMVSGSDFNYNYVDVLFRSRGGAIYLGGNSSFIVNCNFNENRVFHQGSTGDGGAAIYVAGTVNDTYILGCDFIENNAYSGGAIRIDGYATINHCGFYGNEAQDRGGAVNNEYGGASIHNSTFISNMARNYGGAIYSTKLNLTDSNFKSNTAYEGGAVYASSATVINSNFTENNADYGGAISCKKDLTLDNIGFSQNTDNSGTNNIHTDPDTEVTISNIDSGYQIIADDASYSINSGGKYSVTVKDAEGNLLVGENVTFSVGKTVIGSALSDENGVATIDLTPSILKGIKAGTHNLQVILVKVYQDKTVKLTIKKDSAAITARAASFVINYAGKYSVTLKNSAGNVLSGQKVTFTLNGKYIGSATTNANGVATISFSAKVLKAAKYGTKKLVIKLDSPLYTASSKTIKVKINKEKTKIVAAKKSFKRSLKVKKYTITLRNSNGKIIKKAKLTLKVKGKTFKATTNSKGKATFKITNLKKRGKFTAYINFKTTAYYLKASKSVKLTIK